MEFDGNEYNPEHFRPNPKKPRVKLSPARLSALKLRLYMDRAKGRCESCGDPVRMTGTIWTAAHLSHIKSVGAGGDDTEENCRIECPDCHLKKKHGLRWSKG